MPEGDTVGGEPVQGLTVFTIWRDTIAPGKTLGEHFKLQNP